MRHLFYRLLVPILTLVALFLAFSPFLASTASAGGPVNDFTDQLPRVLPIPPLTGCDYTFQVRYPNDCTPPIGWRSGASMNPLAPTHFDRLIGLGIIYANDPLLGLLR